MTKIHLSAEEMQLVRNSHWILTKHRIIEKVYTLFGGLAEKMQLHLTKNQHGLAQEVLQVPPKISKGEQYESLPYVVLDYPRLFSKENVFAVRSFFWWGNYFSITLHLKGTYLLQWQQKIRDELTNGKWKGFYFSGSGHEFSFNLEGKHYFLAAAADPAQSAAMPEQSFLKISCKVSFEHWDTAEQKLMEVFERFMQVPDAG